MQTPVIYEWAWDDDNLEHMARHGVRRRHVEQVAAGNPLFRTNLAGRAATHQMVGPDANGRIWVICMFEMAHTRGVWRVVTGWPADKGERDWYNANAAAEEHEHE